VHDIWIPVGDRRVAGRLFEPPHSRAVVTEDRGRAGLIFVHGLNSSQHGYIARAEAASLKLSLTCLTFDLEGHGKSKASNDEQLSHSDHLQDLEAAYDRLISVAGIDPARIGMCGASYGAYLACLLIGTRQIRRLLLRAPALHPDKHAEISPETLKGQLGSDTALRNLANFGGGILVLESGADEVIPHSIIETYLAACRNPVHHVIEGAAHALYREEWNAAFIRDILLWFKDL
jgi:uncharacterized protein